VLLLEGRLSKADRSAEGLGFGADGGAEGFGGELIGVAKAGEERGPEAGDDNGADAAEDGGADGSPPLGGESALEFAELVGSADEEGVDGRDTAAHLIGRGELKDRAADDNADGVRGAGDDEGEDREKQMVRETEGDGGAAEDGDADKETNSGMTAEGIASHEERHEDGANGGSRAEQAKATRAGVENVVGEDGSERDGSAEQDGEEIERGRAKEQRRAEHVAEASENDLRREVAMFRTSDADLHAGDEDERPGERTEIEEVNDARAFEGRIGDEAGEGEGEEYATDGGTDDGGELEDGCAPGDRIHKVLFRHEMRNERRICRS